jgi:hypothetical protein
MATTVLLCKKNSQNHQRLTQPELPAPVEYQLRRMGASTGKRIRKEKAFKFQIS